MAVVFDANSTATNGDVTANAVTSITSSALTVGSGSNRALIANVAWSQDPGTVTPHWDQLGTPQTLTAVTGATASSTDATPAIARVYGLVAPTSGAKQISFSWTNAADIYLNHHSWTGVDQTGGATSFPHGTGNAATAITATVTVTSAVGNATVACHVTKTTSASSVNNTQTWLDNGATNISGAGNRAAGAASVTLTCTLLASDPFASAGCDIAAAGAGLTAAQEIPIFDQQLSGQMVGQVWR